MVIILIVKLNLAKRRLLINSAIDEKRFDRVKVQEYKAKKHKALAITFFGLAILLFYTVR